MLRLPLKRRLKRGRVCALEAATGCLLNSLLNRSSDFCRSHSSEIGLVLICSVRFAGCRPSRMSSTIAGANSVIRNSLQA